MLVLEGVQQPYDALSSNREQPVVARLQHNASTLCQAAEPDCCYSQTPAQCALVRLLGVMEHNKIVISISLLCPWDESWEGQKTPSSY